MFIIVHYFSWFAHLFTRWAYGLHRNRSPHFDRTSQEFFAKVVAALADCQAQIVIAMQEALYFGVPMLVIPQQMEQWINGRLLQSHGAGLLIGNRPKPHFTLQELRAAVGELLTHPSFANAAAKIGNSFHNAGGYELAATIIENKAGRQW